VPGDGPVALPLGETGGLSLRDLVLDQDVVYVGGGSMRSLLAIWREYGLDAVLREAWEAGVLLAGLSAGAMCWFAGGVTMSTGVPAPVRGLGLLPWSLSVHADGDPGRLPVYEDAVGRGRPAAGWAADDGVGLLFEGTRLVRTVSSRPHARAVRVDPAPGRRDAHPRAARGADRAPRHERPVAGDVLEFRRTRLAAGRRRR
jgi:peptidase E